MTADVELLPCPFCGSAEPIVAEPPEILPLSFQIICSGSGCNAMVESRTLARAKLMWNRRANVAHATAAKDAEIEALRAEVATWEGLHASEVQVRQRWQARAERLAEALRLSLNSHGKTLLTDPPQDAWKVNRVEEIGRALLREQEEGHEQ